MTNFHLSLQSLIKAQLPISQTSKRYAKIEYDSQMNIYSNLILSRSKRKTDERTKIDIFSYSSVPKRRTS
jgi:hypothetical protein